MATLNNQTFKDIRRAKSSSSANFANFGGEYSGTHSYAYPIEINEEPHIHVNGVGTGEYFSPSGILPLGFKDNALKTSNSIETMQFLWD